ncbi:MAG: putative colanic acid biosynthesis acetyltransferase [Methylocystis silviterrae]|uniref:putative colanic acid biosynthesis acetyltransferase n=1 Tax=Methylocystis silviterrae TaxID=2743612 RepID=UPI003C76F469
MTNAKAALRARPAPSSADKFRRAVWNVVWVTLFRPTPVVLHGWRRSLLRAFGARIGSNVHPYPAARIWAPWNLVMEEGSCLGSGCDCYSVDHVRIGRNAVVSQAVSICTASHDHRDPAFPLVTAPVTIEAGAWVAAEAFVGPGVTIGERAVVAARAVVVRDIPAEAIVAGNPARHVGHRSSKVPA